MRSPTALRAAALACAAPATHADQFVILNLSVRLHVEGAIASRVISRALETETANVWRPYGVRLEWAVDGAPKRAGGVALDAIVQRSTLSTAHALLGLASVGPESMSTPVRMSFDATERVLAGMQPIVRDTEVSRALGRVLAHEIGHVLLAASRHDVTGLMRANFTAGDLAGYDPAPFRLTCNAVDRLRSRVPARHQ